MPVVQGPDGRQVQFPDGTSPDTMHQAMTQLYANKPGAVANPTPVNIDIRFPGIDNQWHNDNSIPIKPSELEQDGAPPAKPDTTTTQPTSLLHQMFGGAGELGSALRGYSDAGTLGWAPKIDAGIATGVNYLGRAIGTNKSTASLGETYKQLLDMENRQRQADADVNPASRLAGQVGGTVATFALPGRAVAKGANLLTKAAIGAANGGLYGAVAGAGNAPLGSEISGAASGGATGLAIGAAAAPVVALGGKAIGPQVRDFVGRLTRRDAGNEGIAALARRTTLDPMAMADTAAKFRAAGVEPSVTDVVSPQARSVIAQAGKGASNQQLLIDQATTRAAGLPDAVTATVNKHVAGGGDTAATLEEKLKSARTTLSNAAYGAARDNPVVPSPELKATLGTNEGQSAIRDAIAQTTDKATRQHLMNVAKWAAGPDEIPADVLPEALRNLSPDAQASVAQQLGLSLTPRPLPPPHYTAGMAESIASRLQDKANKAFVSGAPRRGAVLKDFAQGITQHAQAQSQALQDAAQQHVALSQPINALETGAKFTGTNAGGQAPPDVAAELAKTQATANPLTQSAARVAARDQVLAMAGRERASALSTADHMSLAPDQRRRNVALLGEEAGDALANTLEIHASRVRNANAAVTTSAPNANANPADIDAIIGHAFTGGKSGIVYAMRRMLGHGGVGGLSAKRLVEDAVSTDPARVDAAIAHVSKMMDPKRATMLIGSIGRVAGNAAGGTVGSNQ